MTTLTMKKYNADVTQIRDEDNKIVGAILKTTSNEWVPTDENEVRLTTYAFATRKAAFTHFKNKRAGAYE